VGLKSDGTVIAAGNNGHGQCDVGSWTDILQVAADRTYTVGVKGDGTVVATKTGGLGAGDVGSWANIVQVAAGFSHTVGVKADGTVVAVGWNDDGQCDVGSWTDIVQVAAHSYHTVGLKADGTVVAVGNNDYGQCDVGSWTDIVQVCPGRWYTVGVRSDGTVVAVGGDAELGIWNLVLAWPPSQCPCFIATAAYGTPLAGEIQILREFRDKYLVTNPLGQALVNLYYRVSPPIAQFITQHSSLKPIVRSALVPVVAMSAVTVKTATTEEMAILGLAVLISAALVVWATRRWYTGPLHN
jgi:hypothetical protein